MATFTGSRAGASFPGPYAPINGGTPWAGVCAVAANPTAAQTFGLFWVPAGFVCVGGMFYSSDLDTNASETLEWNLGWAANGGSGTYDAVDTDGLGDFGVMNGDAFANPSISPVTGNIIPFSGAFLVNGLFPFFTKKTLIQAYCVATCATFAAGSIGGYALGYVDPTLAVGN